MIIHATLVHTILTVSAHTLKNVAVERKNRIVLLIPPNSVTEQKLSIPISLCNQIQHDRLPPISYAGSHLIKSE